MSANHQSPLTTTCRFRYRGYTQNNGVREFAFEDTAEQKNTHPVVFDVDVQLPIEHHVHFQDAPRLCLLLLSGNPLTAGACEGTAVRIVVSDGDLTELLAKAEAVRSGKKHARSL
jgi:hypothetical protein